MRRLSRRIQDELIARGMPAEAGEIAALLESNLAGDDPSADPQPTRDAVLPTHCPNCGGTLHPDEIEWLDGITAECAYCGSPVRGNS
jgi:hypothetical protein